jgi:hypothetical protein
MAHRQQVVFRECCAWNLKARETQLKYSSPNATAHTLFSVPSFLRLIWMAE